MRQPAPADTRTYRKVDAAKSVNALCKDLGIDLQKKIDVLIAATEHPFPTVAAGYANVLKHTVLGWLGRWNARPQLKDDAFCEAWDLVTSEAVERVEQEILKRSRAGVEDKSSADLAKFLAKAWKRNTYGDKQEVEHKGEGLKSTIVLHGGTRGDD